MYYERGIKQEQIARSLGVSRSQVSRYLAASLERGITQIRVIAPDEVDTELEAALRERFPRLAEAVVLPSLFTTGPLVRTRVASIGADVLARLVRRQDTVCIGAGRTLSQLVSALTPTSREDVVVVQAMGNAGHEGLDIDYNAIASAAAAAFGGRAFQVNAPAILGAGYDAKRLEASNQSIADALGRARRADIFIVGLGSLETDSLYVTTGLLAEEDLAEIAELEPAGDICGHFYDLDGRPLPTPFSDRLVGIGLEDLRRADRVLAVAGGIEKAAAIQGALTGGYVTHLVTDEAAARTVVMGTSPRKSAKQH
ncbi:MAG TPA: sugar-binding transcriptional regulator [Streptosporangiaceae bacterium]|nr:sugar-binding transcriptional regulator [Streptosporangiaceae bacterium]